MATGDVYKLTLNSRAGTQLMQNIFFYRQTLGFAGGQNMVTAFINQVMDSIGSITHTLTTFGEIEWINYNDPGDFGSNTDIVGDTGVRTGEALPIFCAWAFQYNRASRITRNGAKRFSLIAESDQNAGVPTTAMLDLLNASADGLGQYINFGASEIWQPVIVRLSEDGSTPLLVNDVSSVTFKRLSSQNSRKGY